MESAASSVGGAAERLRSEVSGVRGARLRASAPQYLLLAALGVLVALGLKGLIWPPAVPPSPRPPVSADAPSEDFALQFTRAYLNYDAKHPGRRAQALAPFLPEQLARDGGLGVMRGRQRVLWAQVASDQPALVGGRVVTVAARVSTQRLPVYLAVTVRHRRGGSLELAGYPSFVGAPAVSTEAQVDTLLAVEDRGVTAVVARVLRNYLGASIPNLKADLTPDAAVSLPTLALTVRSIDRVQWVDGRASGAVVATVTAEDARGATYTLTYELGIAYRERPYVAFVEVIPTAG